MIRPVFHTTSALKQLLILFFVLCAFFIVFAIVSSLGMIAFPKNLNNSRFPVEYTQYLLFVQGVTMMILPSIVFTFLTNLKPWQSIGMQKISSFIWIPIATVAIISIQPFVEFVGIWNSKMVLPESLGLLERWMRESEEMTAQITSEILSGMQTKNIIANFFIMALIPAIGEELIFRGCFQKVIGKWWNSAHLAIFVTAFLFSAIHLQFYGFLPRFLLGLLLGYLFYWSKNLWIPIIAHFLNNLMVLLLYYYYITIGGIDNPLAMKTSSNFPLWAIGVCTLVFALTFFLAFKVYRRAKSLKLMGLVEETNAQ